MANWHICCCICELWVCNTHCVCSANIYCFSLRFTRPNLTTQFSYSFEHTTFREWNRIHKQMREIESVSTLLVWSILASGAETHTHTMAHTSIQIQLATSRIIVFCVFMIVIKMRLHLGMWYLVVFCLSIVYLLVCVLLKSNWGHFDSIWREFSSTIRPSVKHNAENINSDHIYPFSQPASQPV